MPWADFTARVLDEVPPERVGPTAREAVERLARQPERPRGLPGAHESGRFAAAAALQVLA